MITIDAAQLIEFLKSEEFITFFLALIICCSVFGGCFVELVRVCFDIVSVCFDSIIDFFKNKKSKLKDESCCDK